MIKKIIPLKIKDYIKNKKKELIYNYKLDTSISVSENLGEYTYFVDKAANNDDIFKNLDKMKFTVGFLNMMI